MGQGHHHPVPRSGLTALRLHACVLGEVRYQKDFNQQFIFFLRRRTAGGGNKTVVVRFQSRWSHMISRIFIVNW